MTTIHTSITSRPNDLAEVSRLLDELAASHDLPPDVGVDMHVALDEVLSNIIRHAYSDDRVHEIRIRLTVAEDVIEAEIEDDGRPFNPLTIPPPQLTGSLHERQVGGLGIHFVRSLMNEVSYSLVGNRNRLVLRKHLTNRTEADTHGRA